MAAILKNPAYAGAFVYGRTRTRAHAPNSASRAKAPRPIEEWRIVVKGRYPAYVDWQTYEMIRSVIRDNRAEYMRNKTRGAPRDGALGRGRFERKAPHIYAPDEVAALMKAAAELQPSGSIR